jgi:hypothetical protein
MEVLMAKEIFCVLARILTSFVLLAIATLAAAQAKPAVACQPLPAGCNSGSCTIRTEWIRDNQSCPETGRGSHASIVINKDEQFYIAGRIKFKVNDFKEYKTKSVDDTILCDWKKLKGPAKPFKDVTKDAIPGANVDLGTFSQVHVLEATTDCVGCYKVNFSVQGGPNIDPHIQAGGSGKLLPNAVCK